MRLIFLYGMPATGKLTVAQELKHLTGFPLFHNHLVVDMLLSTFEFGSEPFVMLREQIWLSVFDQAGHAGLPGMIFTFAPEATVRPTFIPEMLKTVEAAAGGTVDFAELTCPLPEIRSRLAHPSRRRFGKLTSAELFDQLLASKTLDMAMPKPKISIDTSTCSPARAALEIARSLALI